MTQTQLEKARDTSEHMYIAEPIRTLAISIETLNLDSANLRLHNDKNIKVITSSLSQFGQRKPIVVQKRGMIIRAGNGTVTAAQQLGWTHIAAVILDDDDLTAASYAIADNRSAELANWDESSLLKVLNTFDKSMKEAVGYDQDSIDKLLKSVESDWTGNDSNGNGDENKDDEVPSVEEIEAITKRGDIWTLGNHSLLCGDSANDKDVDILVNANDIHLLITDPPYNINVKPSSNKAILEGVGNHVKGCSSNKSLLKKNEKQLREVKESPILAKNRLIVSDSLSTEEYDKILNKWFSNIGRVLKPGSCFYIWGGYINCGNYPKPLKDNRLYFSQVIIWVKEWPVLSYKDFMSNHEWCFYGWKEGAGHKWLGPTNVVDVWNVKKSSGKEKIHLTEKPVELAYRAIKYSSREGENVLDLFGGSGSTMIACEKTNRNCYMMEIDEVYCDVIINRWEKFTGKKAVRN